MKKLKTVSLLLLSLLLLPHLPLWAQQQTRYEHSVAVADDSDRSLAVARRAAMEAVLVEVSGNSAVASGDGVAVALENAQDYVARYGFQAGSGSDSGQLYLWVAFDPAAIDVLLDEAGGAQRSGGGSETLVWLVSQQGSERVIEGVDGDSSLIAPLRQRAQQRGVAVVMPLLDLQDQRAVTASDLWGNFPEAVIAASARYPAGVVLVGRIEPQGLGWVGHWSVYQSGRQRDFETRGESREQVVIAGVDVHADQLGAVYTGSPAGADAIVSGPAAGTVLMQVVGVATFADYLRLSSYLQRLAVVGSVRPQQLNGDRVALRVDLRGGIAGFQRTLSADGVLAAGAPAGAQAGLPEYQLRPAYRATRLSPPTAPDMLSLPAPGREPG